MYTVNCISRGVSLFNFGVHDQIFFISRILTINGSINIHMIYTCTCSTNTPDKCTCNFNRYFLNCSLLQFFFIKTVLTDIKSTILLYCLIIKFVGPYSNALNFCSNLFLSLYKSLGKVKKETILNFDL